MPGRIAKSSERRGTPPDWPAHDALRPGLPAARELPEPVCNHIVALAEKADSVHKDAFGFEPIRKVELPPLSQVGEG